MELLAQGYITNQCGIFRLYSERQKMCSEERVLRFHVLNSLEDETAMKVCPLKWLVAPHGVRGCNAIGRSLFGEPS
jgi:hypothetical protein